jgi:hypothetical protein
VTRALLAAALLLVIALSATAAGQAAVPGAATARLEGAFEMLGRVTVAQNVTGEHRGERAKRLWTFMSRCAAGQCATIRLIRHRAGGVDRLTLKRHAPGYYTGTGLFYAPLSCASHTVRRGESVPFRITVRIRAAAIEGGVKVASALTATYLNRSRKNLTQCVAIPGHDGARYAGQLTSLPPPSSGSGGTNP